MNKPDIVLVTIDSWRADRLGIALGRTSLTPNLDRFAATSSVFTQAFSAGAWTLPAMISLLSSTYSSMYGGLESPFAKGRPHLAGVLRDAGFSTAGFSSNPLCGQMYGFDAGFDHFEEVKPPSMPTILRVVGRRIRALTMLAQFCCVITKQYPDMWPYSPYVDASELTNTALRWWKNADGRPRFMWVHYMDAHVPLRGSALRSTLKNLPTAWQLERLLRGGKSLPKEVVELYAGFYDEEVRFIDEHVGRLLSQVGDALVVVTGDHGEEFMEHGLMHHDQIGFEETMHVPLLLHRPGSTTPVVHNRLISHIDVATMVLDAVGTAPAPGMLGRSWADYTAGTPLEPEIPLVIAERKGVWSNPSPNYDLAIRTERYKYIYDSALETRSLFDLQADPEELRDVLTAAPTELVKNFDRIRLEHFSRGLCTDDAIQHSSAGRNALPASVELTPQVRARLAALGYLEE